jgi:pSer/pThr/pTyr-binding forkhead associated (FHA) protein
MFCNNCGHRNQEGANFCSSCGAVLPAAASGDTTLTLLPEKEAESEEEFPFPIDELEEGTAILIVRRGPEAGTKFVLDKDVITCGRDPASDLFLDDVTVSRKHAEIRRNDSAFTLADVGSLNGTFANRQRVEQIQLSNGDEIQIGKFQLIFFTGAATE